MSTAKMSGRAKLRKWCNHIYIEKGMIDYHYKLKYRCIYVWKDWKFCPICGKPRPKTGGIER